MPALAASPPNPLTALRVICLAMIVGVVILGAVGAVLVRTGTVRPEAFPAAGTWSLAGVALLQLLLAPVLERRIAAGGGAASAAADRARRAVGGKIVGFALREAAGILGVVLGLLTGELRWILGLGGLAVATMLLAFPRRTT